VSRRIGVRQWSAKTSIRLQVGSCPGSLADREVESRMANDSLHVCCLGFMKTRKKIQGIDSSQLRWDRHLEHHEVHLGIQLARHAGNAAGHDAQPPRNSARCSAPTSLGMNSCPPATRCSRREWWSKIKRAWLDE